MPGLASLSLSNFSPLPFRYLLFKKISSPAFLVGNFYLSRGLFLGSDFSIKPELGVGRGEVLFLWTRSVFPTPGSVLEAISCNI